MKFNEMDRMRCDRCGQWREFCSLVTLHEELFHLLTADNEFSVCMKCIDKYSIDQWTKWIPKGRAKFEKGAVKNG